MRENLLIICFCSLISLVCCACNPDLSNKKVSLAAMGATFPQPFYNVVSANYIKHTGVEIHYNGTNSGNYLRAFRDRVIDFASVSAFLPAERVGEFGSEIVQIPSTLGAIVLAFNIPNVTELNLTGAVIADIYLANIVCWNDSSIAALNPGVDLPDLLITPVFRSDESDVTATLSYFLGRTHAAWAAEMGVGKLFVPKRGIAIKGNPAIASVIGEVAGSIGYTGLEHASLLDLPVAAIQNRSGGFIKPNRYSIRQAAKIELPDDMLVSLVDSEQKGAYPICSFSWLVVYKNQAYNGRSLQRCEEIKLFFNYVLSPEAQGLASKLSYSPLPPEIVVKARRLINSIEWNER